MVLEAHLGFRLGLDPSRRFVHSIRRRLWPIKAPEKRQCKREVDFHETTKNFSGLRCGEFHRVNMERWSERERGTSVKLTDSFLTPFHTHIAYSLSLNFSYMKPSPLRISNEKPFSRLKFVLGGKFFCVRAARIKSTTGVFGFSPSRRHQKVDPSDCY